MIFEVIIEDFNAVKTTFNFVPAHVPRETPELIAEGRAWVGHETVELMPDRCAIIASGQCRASTGHIQSTPDIDLIKSLKPLRFPRLLTASPTEQLGEKVELAFRTVMDVELERTRTARDEGEWKQ
ncbi:hypothetical protein HBI54_090680 [Parastagonospora nodorum]|nr:hypothetical protein HBI54_090680 [Parastagonospora nodorum]